MQCLILVDVKTAIFLQSKRLPFRQSSPEPDDEAGGSHDADPAAAVDGGSSGQEGEADEAPRGPQPRQQPAQRGLLLRPQAGTRHQGPRRGLPQPHADPQAALVGGTHFKD
ncbi:unnamed protein product [Nezara viridula]|uniref:Uncharacterized protein n=1 Tax=Nezara viridula TaxID=85310 RepID=A0A9P0H539_NEZVI|nr:unnamed protein product [Nezara viridula]